MNTQWRSALAFALIVGVAFHAALGADDKKPDTAKKKEEPAKPIVVDGELINADLKDKVQQQSYCKTYTLRMEKDKTYQIIMTSTAFKGFLRLEDGAGNQVDFSPDRFGSATIFHRPGKTEDFQIVATSQAPATGKFNVTIRDIPADDGKPVEIKNDKGQGSVTSNLLKSSPAYQNGGRKAKTFLFEMEKGKTYQIDMVSKAFDSYLYFESPGGQLLNQNDDGGGYPNARIVFQATESGKHRIICSHYDGNVGEFALTIRQNK